MRVECGLFMALLCAGCAVDLSPKEDQTHDAEPVQLTGCRPLPGATKALEGRLGSALLPDDRTVLLTSSGSGVAYLLGADEPCAAAKSEVIAPLFDVSALELGDDVTVQPLAAVHGGDSYAFFSVSQADGTSGGYGVARWDDQRKLFAALALLWTADRPNYGSGAAIDDGYVYVVGGLAARFLDADIYVARVPEERIAEFDAYEYAQSGGGWQPSADLASPMATGGTSPSLAFHEGKRRWLLAYATPLATTATLRSGLGPAGPWSLPVELGRCALPAVDADSFCADVTLQPLFFGKSSLVLAHGVASFAPPKSARATDYWPRWLTAKWPSALP